MSLVETNANYKARYDAWAKIMDLMTQVEGIDAEINNANAQITQ